MSAFPNDPSTGGTHVRFVPPAQDTGEPDTAEPDTGGEAPSGGCDCAVSGQEPSALAVLASLSCLVFLGRRRRYSQCPGPM